MAPPNWPLSEFLRDSTDAETIPEGKVQRGPMLRNTLGLQPHVEHSDLFTVAHPKTEASQLNHWRPYILRRRWPPPGAADEVPHSREPGCPGTSHCTVDPPEAPVSTTSVLTATTSKYITRVGITAAAGTELAL